MMFSAFRQSLRWGFRPARNEQTRRRSTRSASVRLHCEVLEDRALLTVNPILGFEGLDHTADSFRPQTRPPDTTGAAGPSAYIETVNLVLASYNKTTGAQIASEPFSTFFKFLSPETFSDPVIDYNEITGRFAIGMLDYGRDSSNNPTDSRFDFAISNKSNPSITNLSDWSFHQFDTSEGGSFFSDYPKMGYNADGYVASFNMFSLTTGNYDHTSVMSIANDETSPGINDVPTTGDNSVSPPAGIQFTLAPATMHGSSPGASMWFVEDGNGNGGGNTVTVAQMINPFSASPTYNFYNLGVPSYGDTTVPRQPGGDLGSDLGTRFYFSALRTVGGTTHLVAADTVGNGTGDSVRWYDINVGGATPTLIQQGTINPNPAHVDTYLPSIDIAPDGTYGMTYAESSDTTEYMSMYVTGRTQSDPLGTMEPSVLAKAGDAALTGNRFGDYSFTMVDPTDGTFWSANEWGKSGTFPNWSTWIEHFQIASIAAKADKTTLWPPNGKLVPVTVTGTITGDPTSASYHVVDEYGAVQPSGSITVNPDGTFSFTIYLDASRDAKDLDGRLYQIVIDAVYPSNLTVENIIDVIVPHDQGH